MRYTPALAPAAEKLYKQKQRALAVSLAAPPAETLAADVCRAASGTERAGAAELSIERPVRLRASPPRSASKCERLTCRGGGDLMLLEPFIDISVADNKRENQTKQNGTKRGELRRKEQRKVISYRLCRRLRAPVAEPNAAAAAMITVIIFHFDRKQSLRSQAVSKAILSIE